MSTKAYYDINKLYMYLLNNSDLAQEDLTDVYEVAQKIVNLIEKYNENEYINFVNGNVVEDIESYLIDKKEKEEK